MPSHFSDVGFTGLTRSSVGALALRAAREGRAFKTPQGTYYAWSPGAGVQLWPQTDPNGRPIGCHPHFEGTGRVEVAVTAALPGETHSLDGSFQAWAAPGDRAEDGAYPFVFDAPDFALALPSRAFPCRAVAQIAAFAEELTCYADEAAFSRAKTEDSPGLAPEAFIPTGLFTQNGERPRVAALFAGHILASERRVNPAAQGEFYWLSVQTYGGVYDVVADPEFMPRPPAVGGIAQGSFWLSGRVLPEAAL